jgi:hypothetical protein
MAEPTMPMWPAMYILEDLFMVCYDEMKE